jgi:DNA ligase D-like protein (predicted 3'-phosphoesterase)
MSTNGNTLGTYRARRSPRRSGEPAARQHAGGGTAPRFVVQHHLASSDHYDFRLQVGGVLKSWAIPKGPSVNPRDKRMARATEDHPLEYESFEGVIPEGDYGAGAVQVWDRGSYQNVSEEHGEPVAVAQALSRGHVSMVLDGHKLRGGFALTRIRGGRDETWLLVKKADEHASTRSQPIHVRPESVLSGRTVQEIQAGGDRSATKRPRRS